MCVILFCANSEAKTLNAKYKFVDTNSRYSFSLSFYKNGEYKFEITTYLTPDMLSSSNLSSGNYKFFGDSIILYDSVNCFKSLFLCSTDFIISNNFFYGLKNVKLKYVGANKDLFKWDRNAVKINKSDIKYRNKKALVLRIGSYVSKNSGDEIKLNLNKNKTFVYALNNWIVLQGTFKRNNNQLILHDITLNQSFIFEIESNIIIDNFLIKGSSLYSFR